MNKYTIFSSFESLPIEVFWYPCEQNTKRIFLLLKGLYSIHDPLSADSWDTELIRAMNSECSFVCINTSRKGKSNKERESKEAFIGKVFEQECGDVRLALQYLIDNKIISPTLELYVIGNSFGGTVLLGMPDLLKRTEGIMMIGSGCGKSLTTTKPLLSTLPEEEILLTPLRSCSGKFIFVRGALDTVVPKYSQDKIIENALSASVRVVYTIFGAGHDLNTKGEGTTLNRTEILATIVRHLILLGNTHKSMNKICYNMTG